MMEGDDLFKIVDKYFWDDVSNKYTCSEAFLTELNEFREKEFANQKDGE